MIHNMGILLPPRPITSQVLLLGWCDFDVGGPYAFFEVFSGKGMATRVWSDAYNNWFVLALPIDFTVSSLEW